MSVLQTKVTTIDYDKKTRKIALMLKEQIDQNPLIFKMILSGYKGISFGNKEGYFNILNEGNVNTTLESRIISILEKEYQKDAKSNTQEEIELAVLKYALIERTNSFNLYNIERLPENMIYYYIAYLKYKSDFDKKSLISFVLSPKTEVKESLFNALHQRYGITLYNLLLQEQLYLLLGKIPGVKPLDIFLVNNINTLTTLIQDAFTKRLIESLPEKSTEQLVSITFEEYDNLCREYLAQIDPSLKWLEIYLNAQRNGNIKYLKDSEGKWETLQKDGVNILTAPLTGTIEDVVSTIHEISHYITLENIQEDDVIPCTLAEFPSLFFEENIYSFLLEKGYSETQIRTLRKQRENWTEENNFAVLPFLNYLKEFIIEGPITRDKIKEYLNRIYLSISNTKDTESAISKQQREILENNLESLVNNECLSRNIFLIKKNDALLEYRYVIGSYLAEAANKLSETDQCVISDVINYTEHLGNVPPKKIFERLNICLSKSDEPPNKKMYQKV